MPKRWVFDNFSPVHELFVESFFAEAFSLTAADCFVRTLKRIHADPLVDDYVTVAECRWYIVRGGGALCGDEALPEYFFVYTVTQSENPELPNFIHMLLIRPVSALGSGAQEEKRRNAEDLITRTLERLPRTDRFGAP